MGTDHKGLIKNAEGAAVAAPSYLIPELCGNECQTHSCCRSLEVCPQLPYFCSRPGNFCDHSLQFLGFRRHVLCRSVQHR